MRLEKVTVKVRKGDCENKDKEGTPVKYWEAYTFTSDAKSECERNERVGLRTLRI